MQQPEKWALFSGSRIDSIQFWVSVPKNSTEFVDNFVKEVLNNSQQLKKCGLLPSQTVAYHRLFFNLLEDGTLILTWSPTRDVSASYHHNRLLPLSRLCAFISILVKKHLTFVAESGIRKGIYFCLPRAAAVQMLLENASWRPPIWDLEKR